MVASTLVSSDSCGEGEIAGRQLEIWRTSHFRAGILEPLGQSPCFKPVLRIHQLFPNARFIRGRVPATIAGATIHMCIILIPIQK